MLKTSSVTRAYPSAHFGNTPTLRVSFFRDNCSKNRSKEVKFHQEHEKLDTNLDCLLCRTMLFTYMLSEYQVCPVVPKLLCTTMIYTEPIASTKACCDEQSLMTKGTTKFAQWQKSIILINVFILILNFINSYCTPMYEFIKKLQMLN